MNSCHAACKILIPLSNNGEPSLGNHVPELCLGGKPLYAFNKVLIAITISSNQLANQRDGTEGPLLVDGIEDGVLVNLGKLHTGKNAAGLEDSVCLLQGSRHIREVADSETNRVQVKRVVRDCLRQDLCVCLEERKRRLVRGRERQGALLADGEHGGVDVGDGYVDVWVAVVDVGVLQHAEGDVACAAGDVEDALGGADGVCGSWV